MFSPNPYYIHLLYSAQSRNRYNSRISSLHQIIFRRSRYSGSDWSKIMKIHLDIWAASRQSQQKGLCAQWRPGSAWASTQSDQSLRCPRDEILDPQLPMERTANTLFRLGGCPGWSEFSLGAQVSLLVLSCGGCFSVFLFQDNPTCTVTCDTGVPGVITSTYKNFSLNVWLFCFVQGTLYW